MNKSKEPVKSGTNWAGAGGLGAALALAAIALPGCAALALSAVGPAAEYGIDQALSGITTKTFTAPLASLRLAALKSLSRMDMDVTKDEGADGEWAIEAEAGDRTIEIEFASHTAMTTRIRVVAERDDFFFKDGATAEEVVAQITRALERDGREREQVAFEDGGGGRWR